jgi:hypothetical protein
VGIVAELRIAGDGSDVVTISVPERQRRDSGSEGWVDAEIAIKVGAWLGR